MGRPGARSWGSIPPKLRASERGRRGNFGPGRNRTKTTKQSLAYLRPCDPTKRPGKLVIFLHLVRASESPSGDGHCPPRGHTSYQRFPLVLFSKVCSPHSLDRSGSKGGHALLVSSLLQPPWWAHSEISGLRGSVGLQPRPSPTPQLYRVPSSTPRLSLSISELTSSQPRAQFSLLTSCWPCPLDSSPPLIHRLGSVA